MLLRVFVALCFSVVLTACSAQALPDRAFLPLSATLIDAVTLTPEEFAGTPVGGLSGITYDRATGKFYAVSDDRAHQAPARFYTLNFEWQVDQATGEVAIAGMTIEDVTFLKTAIGDPFAPGSLDPESIAFSPRGTVFISSEGNGQANIAPWIKEFDLQTGQEVSEVPLPARFLPNVPIREDDPPHGVQNNRALESLTISWTGLSRDDPFRLFTAPEEPLTQDRSDPEVIDQGRLRLLHYVVNPFGDPVLVSENAYLLEPPPEGAIAHGLTELLALEKEGYWLSLERSFGLGGVTGRLFQVVAGNATDTSRIAILGGELTTVTPLKKRLLVDLTELEIPLDNVEGMTLGPRLPDGSQLLVIVSDDNFSQDQVTQFIFLRLMGN